MQAASWTGPSQHEEVPTETGEVAAANDVMEVYENQRYYGVWKAPAPLERAPWSDAAGCPVPQQEHQLPPGAADFWELVVTPSTDAQGWQYGTIFSHLPYKRPGGRVSRRLEDFVRRRAWQRRQPLQPLPAPLLPLSPEVTAAAAIAAVAGPSRLGTVEVEGSAGGGAGAASGLLAGSLPGAEPAGAGTDVAGAVPREFANLAAAAAEAAAVAGGASLVEAGAAGAQAGTQHQVAAAAASGAPAPEPPGAAPAPAPGSHDRAMELIRAMHRSMHQRHKPWAILPWGPPAIGELRRAHQRSYCQLQEDAKARQLFGPGAPPARSPLHPATPRTLQEDLLAAALHSRAAYGYAAAAGHLASVRSYIRLRTVERLRFDPVGGVSPEANDEALAEMTGMALEDVLQSCWRSGPLQPCHYVAIDRRNACVVLAVRGSLESSDWLSDLCAHPARAQLAGQEGWVHAGMFEAARHVLAAARGALTEAGRRVPGWPLLVTGHSLGGGVAGLLTLLLVQEGLPPGLSLMHCVTLGSAAVLSEHLAEAAEELVTSVVVGSDVVPQLSCASVEALMLEVSRTSPGRQAVQALNQRLAQALGISPQDALKGEDFQSWEALGQASARVAIKAVDAGLAALLTSCLDWAGVPAAPNGGPARRTQLLPQEVQQGAAPAAEEQLPSQQPAGLLREGGAAPSAPPWQGGPPDGRPPGTAMPGAQPAAELGSEAAAAAAFAGSAGEELSDEELAMLAELAVAHVSRAELAGAALSQCTAGAEPCPPKPDHPVLLYPTGRLIWILPPDESLGSSLAAEAATAVEGMLEGVAAAAGQAAATALGSGAGAGSAGAASGGTDVIVGEGRLWEWLPSLLGQRPSAVDGGMAESWAGGRERVAEMHMPGAMGEEATANSRGLAADRGGLMAGHEEAAAGGPATAGGGQDEQEGGAAVAPAPRGASPQQAQRPVATLTDRRSFEHVLILPDVLNDHLLDRYLWAIQQL